MLFSGIPFLYYFLPVVLVLYFLSPRCAKNTVLLVSSLVFYGWGEPRYIVLMVVSILVGYVSGLLIERYRGTRTANITMIAAAAITLGFLIYFKYTDFFIDSFNKATGLSVPLLQIALPIGISFYTFQILSYVIDVYRHTVSAQKNLIHLAAYVAMFPQLIAGPIVRYSDIAEQLRERQHSFDKISLGIRRFILGLSKKVLIANALGELCTTFRASEDQSVLFYWIYAVAFSLQIYFDFSGYSDMAIGLGKIFGFDFLENFNYPFISASITEFWRRWHMSLGSWFRDYVYIPLGGNRVSMPRHLFNIFVVWMLTGFWHGAAWNFVLWGLMFAVLLTIEKLWLLKYLKKSRVLSHVYVILMVLFSFILFNATDLSQVVTDISAMFGAGNLPIISAETVYYLKNYAVILVVALLGSTPLITKGVRTMRNKHAIDTALQIAEPIVMIALLGLVTAYLVDGSFNPFLYFRF